jgi:hypothetical protein
MKDLLKVILGLMINRAPRKQYYLNIGAYCLKKGAEYHVGQIVREKEISPGLFRVNVITGLFYNFQENKVRHTAEKKIIKFSESELRKINAKETR